MLNILKSFEKRQRKGKKQLLPRTFLIYFYLSIKFQINIYVILITLIIYILNIKNILLFIQFDEFELKIIIHYYFIRNILSRIDRIVPMDSTNVEMISDSILLQQ